MEWIFKKSWLMKVLLNFWPPLFFSRIKLIALSSDYKRARVRLSLSAWNKNAVGTHFGGSIFAMTDPFYMLMLMHHLREEHYVWDKYSDIDFIKPGKGKIYADFILTDEIIENIKAKTQNGEKYLPSFTVDIKDESNQVIAKVTKILYVRKKKKRVTNET
jgi:acyl-coenzyme A thioesterase PaaI-like protein